MRKEVKKMIVLIMTTIMIIGATSCETQAEKEAKAEATRKATQPAKYTIITGTMVTTFLDVIAYECDDSGDRIHENECHFKWDGAESQTFTAQPEAKKLKIYVSYNNGSPIMTFGAVEGWLQVAYPLRHGETTVINLDGNISIGRNMP